MRGHFLVRTLQFGLVAVGLGHSDSGIVGHQDRRRMTVERQHSHVATEPVRKRRGARSLRIRVATRAERADKDRGAVRLLARRAVNRHGGARVIDEQLLAGIVTLAHRTLQPTYPMPIPFAVRAVAQGQRPVRGVILVPQQLQRHMFVALQLRVDRGTVGQHGLARFVLGPRLPDPTFQFGIIEALRLVPCHPGGAHRAAVLRDGAVRQGERAAHLAGRQVT